MAASHDGSSPATYRRGEGGASWRRFTARLMADPPEKGRSPVTISKITMPRA
jgi:hypothetical protein